VGAKGITVSAAALVVAAGMAMAPGPPSASAAGLRTFTDPAGDAGTGFDVTSLAVANDKAGKITFRIALPAVQTLPPNMVISLALNTDVRPTGDSGIDYTLVVAKGGAALVKAAGPGSGRAFIPQSLTSVFTPGLMTVSINRRDLGDTSLFQFLAVTFVELPDGTFDTVNSDSIPSDTLGLYLLALPTQLLVRSARLSPAHPASGGDFSARMFVRDTTYGAPGAPADGGTVTCRFSVGGRPLTAKGSINKAGRAACDGHLPAGTAGARLSGTVRYRLGGVTVSRTFSSVVR
jgi:hypothetical protein